MSMFKKMTIGLAHVCIAGYEVGSDRPHLMVPLNGVPTTASAAEVFRRMADDINGEWVYAHALSPELIASKEFKAAAHEAVREFAQRIDRAGPGHNVPDVTGTACYVLRWEGDDQ